jgi:ferric iron reductase protein FhuF
VSALVTAADPLAPVRATVRAMAARPDLPPVSGLAPDLVVHDLDGWVPATALTSGEALTDFLDTAAHRWDAAPHAGAALAWKCYVYWLALPAVLGYAAARRVPLLRPDDVAVLPTDPLALAGLGAGLVAGVRVVTDEDELLRVFRQSLMDDHLAPILEQIKARLHLGRRTLWGSLASGIAHGLSRSADIVPGSTLETAERILAAFGIDDLVELAPRADGRPGLDIQRRTCCLAFTLPEPTICVGCCIR